MKAAVLILTRYFGLYYHNYYNIKTKHIFLPLLKLQKRNERKKNTKPNKLFNTSVHVYFPNPNEMPFKFWHSLKSLPPHTNNAIASTVLAHRSFHSHVYVHNTHILYTYTKPIRRYVYARFDVERLCNEATDRRVYHACLFMCAACISYLNASRNVVLVCRIYVNSDYGLYLLRNPSVLVIMVEIYLYANKNWSVWRSFIFHSLFAWVSFMTKARYMKP